MPCYASILKKLFNTYMLLNQFKKRFFVKKTENRKNYRHLFTEYSVGGAVVGGNLTPLGI